MEHQQTNVNRNQIYLDHDCRNRREYLEGLSQEYGIEEEIVFTLADVLGESEDFDGLITTLEDHCNGGFNE